MGKPWKSRPSTPTRERARRRRVQAETSSSAVLADLVERFARFRAEHTRGTRVPGELRAATLAALRQGITATELYRTCGVSWGQLEAWTGRRSSPRTGAEDSGSAPADVRVFSVVPEAEPLDEELELRLGRWSVRVRLAEPARGG